MSGLNRNFKKPRGNQGRIPVTALCFVWNAQFELRHSAFVQPRVNMKLRLRFGVIRCYAFFLLSIKVCHI